MSLCTTACVWACLCCISMHQSSVCVAHYAETLYMCAFFFFLCLYVLECLFTFSNLSSLWLVAVGSDKEGHSHNSVWWVKYTLFILVSAPWRIYMPQHWLNVYCFEFAARENWHCVDELLDTSEKNAYNLEISKWIRSKAMFQRLPLPALNTN